MASRELKVEIIGDSRSLQKALGSATDSSSKFGGALAKLGKLAAVGLGALGVGAVLAGKKMLEMASDAAEVQSKMEVIFGKELPELTKNLDAFAEATGASKFALREQAADMGALLEPLTATKKGAADMSVQFVKLATDLGSFNNVPVADALLAIRSGLVGEAEPLRRFGVLLNEAAVNAEGLRMGLIKQGEVMTEQEKVQARANLIMQQTTLAQGDATRTAGSMANQMKALKNNVSDMATSLGQLLIPMALRAARAFNENWPAIEKVVTSVMTAAVNAVTSAINTIQQNFSTIKAVAESAFGGVKSAIEKAINFFKTDFGQTLGIGLAAVLTLKSGMNALGISVGGVGKALSMLGKNPFWALAIPLGLLVGEIVGNFIQSKIAAQQLAEAMDKAAGSARGLKDSLDALKSADLGVKEARLAHTAAVQSATQAEAAWHAAVKKSGEGSTEAKAAYLAFQQQLAAVERAELTLTDAVKRAAAAHTERNAKLREAQGAFLKLTDEAVRANNTFAQTATQERWYQAVVKMGQGAAATSLKAKELGDEAGSRAAGKVALLADAALDLAKQLGRVPTRKEIIAEAKLRNLDQFLRGLGQIPKKADQARDETKTAMNRIPGDLAAVAGSAQAEAAGIGTAITTGIKSGFDFGGLIDIVRSGVARAIEAGKNAGSTTFDASKPIGRDIMGGAAKGAEEKAPELAKVTAESVRKAVGAAALAAATRQIGSKAVQDIIDGIVGETPSLKEQFKTSVQEVLKSLSAIAIPKPELLALYKQYGKSAIDNIIAGLREQTPTLGQETAKAAEAGALTLKQKAALYKQYGKEFVDQIIAGWTEKQPTARQRFAEDAKALIQTFKDAVIAAKGNLTSAFDNLISVALQAFDKMNAGWKSTTQTWWNAEELKRQLAEWNAAIVAAGGQSQAAIDAMPLPEAIQVLYQQMLEAQNAGNDTLAEALRTKLRARVAEQAQIETEAHNTEIETKRTRMEERLRAIMTAMENEKVLTQAELRKYNKMIGDVLAEGGVDADKSGQVIGQALATGLTKAINAVSLAAKRLAKALEKVLKLRSDAEEGPLSDLSTWWVDLIPTLVRQLNPTLVVGTAKLVGEGLRKWIKAPSDEVISSWSGMRKEKDKVITNLAKLDTSLETTGVSLSTFSTGVQTLTTTLGTVKGGITDNVIAPLGSLGTTIEGSIKSVGSLETTLESLYKGTKIAADGVDYLKQRLDNLNGTTVEITFQYNNVALPEFVGSGLGGVPGLAAGGIVRGPMLAALAEKAPEVVAPLKELMKMLRGAFEPPIRSFSAILIREFTRVGDDLEAWMKEMIKAFQGSQLGSGSGLQPLDYKKSPAIFLNRLGGGQLITDTGTGGDTFVPPNGGGEVVVNFNGPVYGGTPRELARALAPEIESALTSRKIRNRSLAFS